MTSAWEHLVSGDFMPHGHCYLWLPEILWMHVTSDAVIAAAYYSIPLTILLFVRKRTDVDLKKVPLLFSAFIFLCGTTHLVGIFVVWNGYYGLQGMVKAATAVVSIFTAITIWRLLPHAIAIPSKDQLVQQVDHATSALSNKNTELAAANAEIENFVSAASHDLKEPLRTLVAYSQLLEEDLGDALNDDAKRDLEHIVSAARRMRSLVQDLLDLSLTSRGEVRVESLSLDDCVDEALEVLQTSIDSTGATITRDSLPTVHGDRIMLRQVYSNLIGNALKFSKPDTAPEVHLTAEQGAGGELVLGVRDNGIGISPKFRETIFQPFKRLHGRDHSEGTGIGLAICRRAIERLGGRVWVADADGGGAHFKFTLRCQEESDDRQETERQPAVDRAGGGGRPGGSRAHPAGAT